MNEFVEVDSTVYAHAPALGVGRSRSIVYQHRQRTQRKATSASPRHGIVVVVERLQQTHQMERSAANSTDMEDLMRAAPDVEPSWTKSFWNAELHLELAYSNPKRRCATHGINDGSRDVPQTFNNEVPPAHLPVSLLNTKRLRSMRHWKSAGPANGAEESRPHPPPFGCPEAWYRTESSSRGHNRRDLRLR
jgi:hypothetical protein